MNIISLMRGLFLKSHLNRYNLRYYIMNIQKLIARKPADNFISFTSRHTHIHNKIKKIKKKIKSESSNGNSTTYYVTNHNPQYGSVID